jgi:DNA-binding NarL/FixJ family response regulator
MGERRRARIQYQQLAIPGAARVLYLRRSPLASPIDGDAIDEDPVMRILIADDHDVVRYGLRKFLERQPGWKVVAEASNGRDAISKAIEAKPDVAILDYEMPLINGVEATRQIRARLPDTEVLIFTVHDDDELIQKCFQAGARSYLLKSNMESQLLSAIEFLAMHKPFFTGRVAETLLNSFLAMPTPGVAQGRHLRALALEKLGMTERSVLQLVTEGHTIEHIAKDLNMTVKLVQALVNYAIHNGLVVRDTVT